MTDRIRTRSRANREAYLARIQEAGRSAPGRLEIACGNFAHGLAACSAADKRALRQEQPANIAIVTAFNDMLSAHQPFEHFPERIKAAAREVGAVAQVAGGVPAMCDGVTQGRTGMELSLFSRDVIAMSTAIALCHDLFDGVLLLGVCDKIVPGLVIGALSFGHLPAIFVPAGPMRSGLPNDQKAKTRQLYAEGRVGRDELLKAEMASYHSPGTCTFYGTSNSNQMLMELMGLHMPGAAFVHPDTPLRDALTTAATQRIPRIARRGEEPTPLGELLDERAFVNGIVGLLATGGSTNHTLHLVAMAAAAGVHLTLDDIAELSAVIPLLARIYPNGLADVNHFQAAGGMAFLIRELIRAGLVHPDVQTVAGPGLQRYAREPFLQDGALAYHDPPEEAGDSSVVRPYGQPFQPDGGIRLLDGNLGRAVLKVSAVKPEHRLVEAPARVFTDQATVLAAFQRGELDRDVVVVLLYQGPRANGMPELHQLGPSLGVLQDRGFRVALVTDGRMSGASGKVPAALHVTPEASMDGPLARLRDGDVVCVDPDAGVLAVRVSAAELEARVPQPFDAASNQWGTARELFAPFRAAVGRADEGASLFSLLSSESSFAGQPTRTSERKARPAFASGARHDGA